MASKDGPRCTVSQIPLDKAFSVTLAIRGAWPRPHIGGPSRKLETPRGQGRGWQC